MQLLSHSQHSLPGYAFLHDFTITQQYYVIFRNPVNLHLVPFVLGRKGAVHSVHWDPNQPLAAHLVPRPPCTPPSPISPLPDSEPSSLSDPSPHPSATPASPISAGQPVPSAGRNGNELVSRFQTSGTNSDDASSSSSSSVSGHRSSGGTTSGSVHASSSSRAMGEGSSEVQQQHDDSAAAPGSAWRQAKPFWRQQSSTAGQPGVSFKSQSTVENPALHAAPAAADHGRLQAGLQNRPERLHHTGWGDEAGERQQAKDGPASAPHSVPVHVIQVSSLY